MGTSQKRKSNGPEKFAAFGITLARSSVVNGQISGQMLAVYSICNEGYHGAME